MSKKGNRTETQTSVAAEGTEVQPGAVVENATELSAESAANAGLQAEQGTEGTAEATTSQTDAAPQGEDVKVAEENSAMTQEPPSAETSDAAPEAIEPVTAALVDVAAVAATLNNEANQVLEEIAADTPPSPEAVQLAVFKQSIETYLKDFAPGVPHHDLARSTNAQLRLARMLRDAPVRLGEHFAEGYAWMLKKVQESDAGKGAFHDDYVFRFYDQPRIRNNPEERDNALFLISFLKSVANVQTRKTVLKQMDIPRILKIFGPEEAQRRVQNFFGMI